MLYFNTGHTQKCYDSHKHITNKWAISLLSVQEHGWCGPFRCPDRVLHNFTQNQEVVPDFFFFYHFVDIGIVNAFILHKEIARSRGERPMSQKAFRENLVLQLQEAGHGEIIRPPQPPPAPTTPAVLHMPSYFGADGTQARRHCVLCKQKTPLFCSTCEVALCLVPTRNCYTQWHIQKEI